MGLFKPANKKLRQQQFKVAMPKSLHKSAFNRTTTVKRKRGK